MKAKVKYKEKHSLKTQIRHLPKYIPLVIWLAFTVAMIGWIVIASLSTTSEIYNDGLLSSGLHFENYINVLKRHKLGTYFLNSILYAVAGCAGVILIASPAAYVLARIRFKGKALVNNIFVLGMSIPSVMLVMPLFKMATSLGLIGSRWTLMILYICVNVPFGVFFLSGFFLSLPKALEEAAEIDGCTPSKAFWKTGCSGSSRQCITTRCITASSQHIGTGSARGSKCLTQSGKPCGRWRM